jgi:hypothetical protein
MPTASEDRRSTDVEMTATPRLDRVAFKTSRLLDFVGRRELTAQIGHGPDQWPLVILKEGIDNGVDNAEEAGRAPEIRVNVTTDPGTISIADNGSGLAPETIADILDYNVRVSSREAYCSPTRRRAGQCIEDDPGDAVRPGRRARHHAGSRPEA